MTVISGLGFRKERGSAPAVKTGAVAGALVMGVSGAALGRVSGATGLGLAIGAASGAVGGAAAGAFGMGGVAAATVATPLAGGALALLRYTGSDIGIGRSLTPAAVFGAGLVVGSLTGLVVTRGGKASCDSPFSS